MDLMIEALRLLASGKTGQVVHDVLDKIESFAHAEDTQPEQPARPAEGVKP